MSKTGIIVLTGIIMYGWKEDGVGGGALYGSR